MRKLLTNTKIYEKTRFSLRAVINRCLGLAGLRLYNVNAFGRDPFHDMKQLIPAPKLLFDVGANIGQTVDIWHKEFPAAEIHSFEPVKRLFEALQSSYGHVAVCNNLALGNEAGTFDLYYGKHEVSHSLVHDTENRGTESVRVTTLDDYCGLHAIEHIDLLKIDVEGFEPQVIEGAKSMLSRHRIDLLLIELGFDPDGYYVYYPDVADKLRSLGYVTLGFYNHALDWDGSARLLFCNVLFAREGMRFIRS